MKKVQIMFNTFDDVKNFVNIVSHCDYDVDLQSGRYSIDAKSIMGIFSLNLSKPIDMIIHSDNCDDFLAEVSSYIAQ